MGRREAARARQLVREKMLYHYSGALERGDFEVVSFVLEEAEGDPVLERLLLEVNEVFRAEMEGQQTSVARAPHVMEGTGTRWSFDRLLRRIRHRSHAGHWIPRGDLIRSSLVAGSVVLGIVLTFVVGWGIYASSGRSVGPTASTIPSLSWPQRGARESGEADGYYFRGPAQPALPPTPAPAPAEPYIPSGLPQSVERLTIRNGSIFMVVEDTRATQGFIEDMVAEMAGEGAYVVSSEEHGGGSEGSPRIVMTIRVPAVRFDETMDRLAGLAVKDPTRGESAQDVTEEYVDLEARLESLEAARQRLLEIMQEASTTDELLKAERQLTEREAEIESLKGRQQYLTQSARLASIWIELQPYLLSQPVDARWRPAEAARQAFETLVDSLRRLGDFMIFFLITTLPWVVTLGLVILGIVRFVLWRVRVGRKKRAAGG